MKCSVYIATSLDGFIATHEDSLDWLHSAGNGKNLKPENADMGFANYLASIDCIIMGRKSMEIISSMNLTAEQWPYGDIKIIILSNTISQAPENLNGKIEFYSGELSKLLQNLEAKGHKHAYIDGGTTIQNFINHGLIEEITITRAPVLLGEGKPLFGKTNKNIKLTNPSVIVFDNDFVQLKYNVTY